MKKILCCVAAALVVALCWPVRCLVLSDSAGHVVFAAPVRVGERYTVRFIHSVARTPVDEIYEVEPDGSILRETVFDMGGAGLPTDLPSPNLTFTREGGHYRITGYNMRLSALTYRVGKVVADHTLFLRGGEYHLIRWVGPAQSVTFRVFRRPAVVPSWHWLKNLFL